MTLRATYLISVLMDTDNSSKSALRSALELAKMVNGRVEALYIKSPLKVVKQVNQLSAKRDLYEDSRHAKATIEEVTRSMKEYTGLETSYLISYGNVKSKVKEYFKESNPDILIIGKAKYRALNGLRGKPSILIVGENDNLKPFKKLSIGIFCNSLSDINNPILRELTRKTTIPIRLFSIKKAQQEGTTEKKTDDETVSYVFSEGANALDGVSSYVERTKTRLFCIPKTKSAKFNFQSDEREQLLRKVNVPVLLMS
ncbi:MAG: universal stress protein [Bacteroidota bacterium]